MFHLRSPCILNSSDGDRNLIEDVLSSNGPRRLSTIPRQRFTSLESGDCIVSNNCNASGNEMPPEESEDRPSRKWNVLVNEGRLPGLSTGELISGAGYPFSVGI